MPLDVESAPLVGSKPLVLRRGPAPGGSHEDERIDWATTSLLFLFPALGGLLFGCAGGGTDGGGGVVVLLLLLLLYSSAIASLHSLRPALGGLLSGRARW